MISNEKYQIDLSSKTHLTKNMYDLEINEQNTPSKGEIKGLVFLVDFPDYPLKNNEYKNIYPTYQSVSSYYYNISYGQLNLSYDVFGWLSLSHKSSYYKNLKNNIYDEMAGAYEIFDEVISAYDNLIDYSKYDSNNDKAVDSIHIIYNHPIDYKDDSFWWAYETYTLEPKSYDKVYPFQFVFASLNFLFEDDESCNARTYIHESGHLFGLPDYYDYDSRVGFNRGLGGYDMMDATFGDFNPLSKMMLGWIDYVYIPDFEKEKKYTYTLNSYDRGGDTILLPIDEFDSKNGIFQTYYLICFNNCNSIVLKDEYLYVNKNGIRIYEVNGVLENIKSNGEIYETLKYDNSYTSKNLINAINNTSTPSLGSYYYTSSEYTEICAKNRDFFYTLNRTYRLPNKYNFVINEINNDNLTATITITLK